MNMPEIHYIDPAQAAHNIASAFCAHEIQKLPDSAFDTGSRDSIPSVKKIWELYTSVYDYTFELTLSGNNSFSDNI